MKSWIAHYKNVYPGCHIQATAHSFTVTGCDDGQPLVHLEKNGAGQWQDMSEEYGCAGRHDTSPIPKNARVWKLHRNGKIALAEEARERAPVAQRLLELYGKVPSVEELCPNADPLTLPQAFTWDEKTDPKAVAQLEAARAQAQLEAQPAVAVPAEPAADPQTPLAPPVA